MTFGLMLTDVLALDGFLNDFFGVDSFASTFSNSDGALVSCERLRLLYMCQCKKTTQHEVKF